MARPLRLTAVAAWASVLALCLLTPGRAATVGDRVASRSAEAEEAYREDDFEEALRLYRDALLEDPDSPALHYNVGDALYKLEQYEAAAEEFNRALTEKSNDDLGAESWHNLGNTLFQQQQFAEAAAAFKNALLQNPSDVETKANLEMALDQLQHQPQQGEQGEDEDGQEEEDNRSQSPSQQEEGEEDQESASDGEPPPEDGSQDRPPTDPDQELEEPRQGMEDLPDQMDEEEAQQLLEALRDREVEAQRRRFRVVPRGHTRDW